MPYKESETKAKIREIMNSAEPVLDGMTDKMICYEVKPEHYQWLLDQARKVDEYEKANKDHFPFGNPQDLTSICLECRIDLGNCICNK
jgi:hypothetical protein